MWFLRKFVEKKNKEKIYINFKNEIDGVVLKQIENGDGQTTYNQIKKKWLFVNEKESLICKFSYKMKKQMDVDDTLCKIVFLTVTIMI